MADANRVISLVRTIAADPSLRQSLAVASEEERGAILAKLGYGDVTQADVERNLHLFQAGGAEEIEDDQLTSVAGGADTDTYPPTASLVCACSVAVAT